MNYFHIVGIGLVGVLIYYIILDIYVHTKVKNDIIREFCKDMENEPEDVQKVISEVLLRIGVKK
jgi:hypothetical protein